MFPEEGEPGRCAVVPADVDSAVVLGVSVTIPARFLALLIRHLQLLPYVPPFQLPYVPDVLPQIPREPP